MGRPWHLALMASLAVTPVLAATDGVATLTILDGQAVILRGSDRLVAVAGVRIEADDVVETPAGAFVRLEVPGGPILDLGGGGRLMVEAPGAMRYGRPAPYLLAGWLKVSVAADAEVGVATPRADLDQLAGVVLLGATSDDTMVFVESGKARVADRRPRSESAAAAPIEMSGGDFVELKAAAPPARTDRPSAALLSSMPAQFRDSLPARWSSFADRPVVARVAGPFSYDDVQPWLDADRTLGRHLVRIWADKAADPAFRSQLTTHLAAHPEWFPVLYPDCCGPPKQ